MSPEPFVLGEWRVEPSLNQISRLARGADSQRITPKAMEVLMVLVGRVGELVTRDEILASVWSGVHVQEEVLTRAVADLRKAFDDNRKEPRYIETIPKRGYRVVAPVAPVSSKPSTERGSRVVWSGGVIVAAVIASVLAWGSRSADLEVVSLEARPLTTFAGREIEPALSHDGTRVAFAWQGEGGLNWDIYVKALSDETLTRLTEEPALDLAPAWSPDGARIAFERYSEMGECRILEVPSGGGTERPLGSCGKSQNPDLAWSPDGRFLAFSDRGSDSESFGIHLLEVESGEKRKLVSPEGQHWGDKDPAFSHDGRFLAFTRSVSMNTQDVYRIPVDGGEPERLTFDGREVRGASFTPDNRVPDRLVGAKRRARTLADTSVEGAAGATGLRGQDAPSPEAGNRRELVFEERWRDSDIDALPLGSIEAAPSPLLASTHDDREPALSPDASRIAFVSSQSGSSEVWVSDASGASPRKLTSFGGPQVGAPSWSPDGRTIAFDARPEGHADLFSISLDGGLPLPIAPSPANGIAPAFAPDGRAVIYGSDQSGTWQIWSSLKREALTANGGYVGRFAPDGTSLYFTKFDSPGLFRHNLESGEEVKVAGTEALADAFAWTFEGGGLLFLGFESGEVRLFRLDRNSSSPALVRTVDADPSGGLAFDYERRRLLLTRVARSESDLLLSALP